MYDNMGIEEIIIAQAENRGIKKGERKGERKGKRAGKKEGILEGIQEAKSTFVRSLLDQTDFSIAKIAGIAGVEEAMVRQLKELAICA